jgi:hypothetical protein
MASRIPRPELPPDPIRDRLKEVRLGLLRLHKALIDAERGEIERRSGPMSSGHFLQMLIQDEAFAWLRPFSELIVQMDEAFATREPIAQENARAYVRQVVALLAPAPPAAHRLDELRRREGTVLAAHEELTRRIAAFPSGDE